MPKITTPTLLVDKEKCLENIRKMAEKAKKSNVNFRPHFKTHQSAEIGEWFKQFGVKTITTSSLDMAEYFVKNGWNNITVAFPFNLLEMEKVNVLSQKIWLNLTIVAKEAIEFLVENCENELGVFIKIDVGTLRTGLASDSDEINRILEVIDQTEKIHFKGFLAHSGHSYHAKSIAEIRDIHNDTLKILGDLKEKHQKKYPNLALSLGDTPCCSVLEDFNEVDEIRPGNFVFYDMFQLHLGVCQPEEIAVAMACPLVAKHPARNEVILYAGGVHLSKDHLISDDHPNYGQMVWLSDSGWSEAENGCYLSGLSQEHGKLKVTDQVMKKLQIGDLVGILPIHSCLTADLLGSYMTMDGKWIKKITKK